jgi:uncharacterized protein (DUF433 family)
MGVGRRWWTRRRRRRSDGLSGARLVRRSERACWFFSRLKPRPTSATALTQTRSDTSKVRYDNGSRRRALDWSQCAAVESVPEKLSGASVFGRTRLPVAAVFANLEDGLIVDEIVKMFDGLTRG